MRKTTPMYMSIALLLIAGHTLAGELTNPIYRVAEAASASAEPATVTTDTASAPASTVPTEGGSQAIKDSAVKPTAGEAPVGLNSPFDLTQRPGEHPLMPCLRLARQGIEEMDANIQDYSAVLTKIERVNGELGEPQHISVKIRHKPFSVYMKFIKPKAGQEALYVENKNDGKLVAMGSGMLRRFGKINLPPDGAMAMKGQLYPITMTGMRNLTAELLKIGEADIKYGECEVRYADSTINQRPCTMIEAIHPVPRKNFRFNIARIFIDNELRIPVAYAAYLWPSVPGGEPELAEQYVYTDVKLNNGFTDADFDPENPNLFQ